MPRRTTRRKKKVEMESVLVRLPKPVLKAFDKSLELGVTKDRSRNSAIVNLFREYLNNIYFVVQLFEEVEAELEANPNLKNQPIEVAQLQIAAEVLRNSERFQEWSRRMAELVAAVAPKLGDPEFKEFVQLLQEAVGAEK